MVSWAKEFECEFKVTVGNIWVGKGQPWIRMTTLMSPNNFFRNHGGLEHVGDGDKQKKINFGGRIDRSCRYKLPDLLTYLFNW